MSTRGAIAKLTGANEFSGRYHHWDSYPTGLGKELFGLYRGYFNRDLSAMLKFLIKDHPAGWSTILSADFSCPPGYEENGFHTAGPQCYCHGGRNEKGQIVTEKNAADIGCEWVYAFTDFEGVKMMHVLSSFCDPKGKLAGVKMIGAFGMGDPNAVWKRVACVDLDKDEPDWDEIAAMVG